MQRMNTPQIPRAVMHTVYLISFEGDYDHENGGQWREQEGSRISFQGSVLPISSIDLQNAPSGTYNKHSMKLYTNGFVVEAGARVFDPLTNTTVTVKQELNHDGISTIRRYIVEGKGASTRK